MAEEDYDLVPYKDISELKRELEGIKEKKDVSAKDVHEAVRQLAAVMNDMLEVFAGAAEQMKLEEKNAELESKKHEMILSKLDKLLEQNKIIAEGMLAVVEMMKEKFPESQKEEPMFKPKQEDEEFLPRTKEQPVFVESQQDIRAEPKPAAPPLPLMAPPMPPSFGSELGMQMPPLEPSTMPDLDFPEEQFPLADEPEQKKKGLFGMFKK